MGRKLPWLAGASVAFALGGVLTVNALRAPSLSAAERGEQLYRQLGCGACHGPGGNGIVPNPGSREREVPAFSGGTAMMYVESLDEVREWILDGRPARLAQSVAGDQALVRMPAYRDRLDPAEVDDLVAYYQAVAWYEPAMPKAVQRGRRVASRNGCFGCHGPSGRVGARNPGSFKGYVPGFGSEDYRELVRDDMELRQWIRNGISDRLAANPAARAFLDTQVITMPAYGDALSADDLESIVSYVRWVSEPRAAPADTRQSK